MSQRRFRALVEGLMPVYPDARCSLDFTDRYQLLCAVLLSSQTTDAAVNTVTLGLFAAYPDVKALAGADPAEVARYIRTIGLAPTKSRNLVALARMLVSDFAGRVPGSLPELTRLPGVGRKTANVVLGVGFGIPAVTVDTHVNRITVRAGLVITNDRHLIEQVIERALPKRLWTLQAHLLIAHGRAICPARRPRCEVCPVRTHCDQVGVA